MVPLSLTLRNFLSYGEGVPPLDFTQFRIACLTGDNGHGKSALLDAITYALWGEARKSQSERKPDEGLCRIGANEMRVDFDFALDDEHFRVIRSWRRTKRGVAQLELQVLDSGVFRSISEGEAVTRTQDRIVQLLAMDYDTFVNSAFIVQGRADEFTQKNARQRKEILGQILGLGRYDQLQSMARLRYQRHSQQAQAQQSRLGELGVELAERDVHEANLRAVNDHLQTLNKEIAAREKDQIELDTRRLEEASIRQRLEELARDKGRLTERALQVKKELEHLRDQQRKDGEILASAEAIERKFATYNQLRTQVSQFEQKVQERRQLDTRCRELEEQVNQARQDVEKRHEKWNALLAERERQLDELKALLEQEQTIAARYARLVATNEQDQALEQSRIRHEALIHERSRLEHAIDLERQNRVHQRQTLGQRLDKLRTDLATGEELEVRITKERERIALLDIKVEKRDRLKEEGSTLNAQIAERRQQLQSEEEALQKDRQQVLALRDSPTAECPLCGSQLDAEHLERVELELAQKERERDALLTEQRSGIADLEGQLQAMRQRYKDLEAETASLQQFNQDLAHLLARHEQLQESTAEAQQLTEQAAALDRELAEQTFAPDQRERLRQLTDEIAQLGYQAKEHAALRQTLADLRKVETEHALLQDARNQADKLTGERTDAQEKRDLALNYLEGRLYAQEEQEALQDVKQQTATLGYDEEEHQQLRRKLDDFSDVVARLERLQAARGRSDSVDETLQRYEEEFQTLGKQLREAEQSQDDLEKRAAELAGVEKRLADNASQLERHRIERDELLQRQGALKTLCTRCAKLAQEQEKLQQALKGDQRQVWIYQRLDEAFGKDGIQALIIENAIPQIEQEANAILSRLTDNRIRVTFDSLRDLKKGGTRETLDVKIADEIGERSYHLYSGGEAFRTNFALRIALSKVLAMRAGTRLRTLFIDEGFGTQDSQGLEQLVEAIQVISRDFDKVLVVTHLDQLKAAFPVQIEVTKHPDLGSRFEVFHHG